MFENIKPARSSWFELDVQSEEACSRAIRHGAIAAYFGAVITFIFALAGMFTSSEDPGLAYLLDPWVMVDAVLLVGLGLLVDRKSRAAATFLLIYFVISKIIMWFDLGAPKGLIVSIVFFVIYLNAARATFVWHREFAAAELPSSVGSRATSRPLGVVIILWAIYFTLLAVISLIMIPTQWKIWTGDSNLGTFIDLALSIVSLGVGVIVLSMIVRRSTATPVLARLYFFFRALLAVAIVLFVVFMLEDPFTPDAAGPLWGNLVKLFVCSIGYAYWAFSGHVRETFAAKKVPYAPANWRPAGIHTVPVGATSPGAASVEGGPRLQVRSHDPVPTYPGNPQEPSLPMEAERAQHALGIGTRKRLCYVCGGRSPMDATACSGCNRPLAGGPSVGI